MLETCMPILDSSKFFYLQGSRYPQKPVGNSTSKFSIMQMKMMRVSTKLNRLIRILQMDQLLPRGSSTSPVTLSTWPPLLHHHHQDRYPPSSSSSSSSSPLPIPCSALSLHSSSSSSLLHSSNTSRTHSFLLCYSTDHTGTSEPTTMDKYSKGEDAGTEEGMKKDQAREGFAKSACDYDSYNSNNRTFDEILPHLLNIYASHATPQDFDIYAPHATFEDPLMRAHGLKQIKSAFYSIPKVFSESRITEYSIRESVISPRKKEIFMDNKQYYKFLGKDIHMISLIKLHLEDGKIVRHEDWWNQKPLWNSETVQLPLVGRFAEMTRRASMMVTHCLMGFGKDPRR